MILVDSHVHIHACFDLASVFNEAARNFRNTAKESAQEHPYQGVLCLTETSDANCFAEMRDSIHGNATSVREIPGWSIRSTLEAESLTVNNDSNEQLIIVAGSQIVAREDLEVLALGTNVRFADGDPIDEVIDKVLATGAIAVVPWGFGKWLGSRGGVVDELIASRRQLYLGDNGNRLQIGREPSHFTRAREGGLEILPGSDPLPFRGEENRIGSYGFLLDGEVDIARPAEHLLELVRKASDGIIAYGQRERIVRFVRNQVAMQFAKRLQLRRKSV